MLTIKDLVATLFAAATVGLYYAKDRAINLPLLNSNRASLIIVLILGLAVCAFSSTLNPNSWSNPWIIFAAVLGGLALLVAVIGLVTGAKVWFTSLVVIVVVLWLITTVRHLFAA